MSQPAPPSLEVQSLQFKILCRLRIFSGQDGLFKNAVSLVAAAPKYGLIFVGTPRGFQVLQSDRIANLQGPSRGETSEYPRREIILDSIPTHMSVSCDQTQLAVGVINNGCPAAIIYNVASFGSRNVSAVSNVRLATSPGSSILDLHFNPGIPRVLGACTSDGGVAVYEFKETGIDVSTLPPATHATCLCWSPKGKQLVIGDNRGVLTQYKPDLKQVKGFPPPPDKPSSSVVNVLWISNYQFAAVYADTANPDERPCIMIVNVPKAGAVSYINFDDICYSAGDLRPPQFYMLLQATWNILMVASANSMEVGVMSVMQDQVSWQQWTQEDAARAELPLMANRQETYPVGMALDTSSTKQLLWGESQSLQPMPMLFLLSHDGLLCIFHTLNLQPGAPLVCTPPQPLPDQSGLDQFVVGHPSQPYQPQQAAPILAPAPAPTPAPVAAPPLAAPIQAPQSTLQISAPASTAPAFQQQPQSLMNQAKPAAPMTGLFGSGGSGFSFAKANVPQSTAPASVVPASIANPSFGTSPGFSFSSAITSGSGDAAQKPMGSLFGKKPALPTMQQQSLAQASQPPASAAATVAMASSTTPAVVNKPLPPLVPVPKVEAFASQQQKQGDSRTLSPGPSAPAASNEQEARGDPAIYAQHIQEEIMDFEKDMKELKARVTKGYQSIGTQDEKKILLQKLEKLDSFVQELTETTKSQNTEIHGLNALTLESFAWVEDAKSRQQQLSNPSYLQLVKAQELDPASVRLMSKIGQMQLYVESQLHEVDKYLTNQWGKFEDSRQPPKNRMYISTMEEIYQAMVNQSKILAKQKFIQEDITQRIAARKLRSSNRIPLISDAALARKPSKHWTVRNAENNLNNQQKGESDLSSLAENLLEMKLKSKPLRSNTLEVDSVVDMVCNLNISRYQTVLSSQKKLSKVKEDKLRERLLQHSVSHIKPDRTPSEMHTVGGRPSVSFSSSVLSFTPRKSKHISSNTPASSSAPAAQTTPSTQAVSTTASASSARPTFQLQTSVPAPAPTPASITSAVKEPVKPLIFGKAANSPVGSGFNYTTTPAPTAIASSAADTKNEALKLVAASASMHKPVPKPLVAFGTEGPRGDAIKTASSFPTKAETMKPTLASTAPLPQTGPTAAAIVTAPAAPAKPEIANFGFTTPSKSDTASTSLFKTPPQTHAPLPQTGPTAAAIVTAPAAPAKPETAKFGFTTPSKSDTASTSLFKTPPQTQTPSFSFGGVTSTPKSAAPTMFGSSSTVNPGITITAVPPSSGSASVASSNPLASLGSLVNKMTAPPATKPVVTVSASAPATTSKTSAFSFAPQPAASKSAAVPACPSAIPSAIATGSASQKQADNGNKLPGLVQSSSVTSSAGSTASKPALLPTPPASIASSLCDYDDVPGVVSIPIPTPTPAPALAAAGPANPTPLAAITSVSKAPTTATATGGVTATSSPAIVTSTDGAIGASSLFGGIGLGGSPVSANKSPASIFGGASGKTGTPSLFGTPAASTVAGTTTPSGVSITPVTSSTQQKSIFGTSTTVPTSDFSFGASSVFGAKPESSTSATTSSTATSTFNFGSLASSFTSQESTSAPAAVATSTAPVFGQTATTAASLFGQATAAATSTSSSSSFSFAAGAASGTPASTAPSLFGQPAPASSTSTSSTFSFAHPPTTAQSSNASSTFSFALPASTAASAASSGQPFSFATQSTSTTGSQPAFGSGSVFGQSAATPASTAPSTFFGQPICSPASTSQSTNVFGGAPGAPTTATAGFGQPATTVPSLFGQSTTTSAFGGKPTFGQSGGSLFGASSTFGSPSSSIFGGSSPQASVFGGGASSGGNLFQQAAATSPGNVFGGTPTSPSSGSFSGGAGVGQTGFGSPSSFQSRPGGFGGAPAFQSPSTPAFGSAPAFGSSSFGAPAAFGGAPGFGSPPKFGSAPAPSFGSPTQSNTAFEALATQNSGMTFGSLAQTSQQPNQSANPFGGGGAASPPAFSNSGPSFGGSSFSSWRR